MHDSAVTVKALPNIIAFLRKSGYELLPYSPDHHVEVNFWNDERFFELFGRKKRKKSRFNIIDFLYAGALSFPSPSLACLLLTLAKKPQQHAQLQD
ncbi:hypothetical protein GCM10020331_026650 [Ectobacillus funiculus]